MSLDEVRQKRLEQLKAQLAQNNTQEQEASAQIGQLELLFRQHATPKALERFGNLKLGHQKKALQVLVIFAQMIQSGRVKEITDDVLKDVLIRLNEKKEIKITRK